MYSNKLCFLILILFHSVFITAQSSSFSYQATLRSADGTLLNNEIISIRAAILENTSSGIERYAEKHVLSTDDYGHINITIGQPDVILTGDMNDVNWAVNRYFLKIGIDPSGGSSYEELGVSPILTVPVAMHAETVTNADDADADPSNELQSITKVGNTIELSNGGGTVIDEVNDADANPSNELQSITKIGNTIELSDGGGTVIDEVNDADANPSNELQSLSLSGNNLNISNGNSVDLSSLAGSNELWTDNVEDINSANALTVGQKNNTHLYIGDDHIDWHGASDFVTSVIERERLGVFDFTLSGGTEMDKDNIRAYSPDGVARSGMSTSGIGFFHQEITVGSTAFPHLYLGADHIDWHNTDNDISSLIQADKMGVFDFSSSLGTEINTFGLFALDNTGAVKSSLTNDGSGYFANQITVGDAIDSRLIMNSSRIQYEGTAGTAFFDDRGIRHENPFNGQAYMYVDKNNFYLGNAISGPSATLSNASSGEGDLSLYDGGAFRTSCLSTLNAGGALNLYTGGGLGYRNVYLGAPNQNFNSGALYLFHTNDTRYSLSVGSNAAISRHYGSNGNTNVYLGYLSGFENNGYVAVMNSSGSVKAGLYVNSAGSGIAFADSYSVAAPNPEKSSDTEIVYNALISGENAAYERGTARLENGEMFVSYSKHFKSIVNTQTMTVELTPLSADTYGLAVIKKKADGFVVKELKGGTGNFEFDWRVTCKRKGFENTSVYQKKTKIATNDDSNSTPHQK